MSAMIVAAITALLWSFFGPERQTLSLLRANEVARASADAPASDQTRFDDVTAAAAITFVHDVGDVLSDIRQVMSPGAALADIDGDDRIDVVLPGAVFRGVGNMKFEMLTASGITADSAGMGCTVGDYDGDRDADVYVTALGPNRLYRNDGRGRFDEVGGPAGVADRRWSAGAAFADYDLDGDLDLYVANYVRYDASFARARSGVRFDRDEPAAFNPYIFPAESDALYRNNGDGTFTDVTADAGVVDRDGKGMGVAFVDVNGDRLPDLLVINDVSPDFFFLNRGDGRFSDESLLSGLGDPRGGMGVAIGDYDNDGAFDVFATHWQDESNVLYRNLLLEGKSARTPLFEDMTIAVRLAAPSIGSTGWGTCWADFDQDADLDLLVVNGYTSPASSDRSQCVGQPAMLFINNRGRFENAAVAQGLASLAPYAARGAATADLDDDGDLDLVVTTNNGPVKVFENRMASGRWLKVRPRGQAIGAVVTVSAAGRTQVRPILAGGSYLCCEPPIAHFGLAAAAQADRVEVVWPDGVSTVLEDVPVNRTLTVERPS